MIIRKATFGDKTELVRLFLMFNDQSQAALSPFQGQLRAYKNPVLAASNDIEKFLKGGIVYVSESDGALTGYIAGLIKEKPNRVFGKEGYVSHWYVADSVQGTGLGKQLFDALTREFEKAKCTHIGLNTHLENTKAIQIYEHLGFTKRLITLVKPLG